jgi:Flp pilus assembly pilin Flp
LTDYVWRDQGRKDVGEAMKTLIDMVRREHGQGLVEYSLVLALVSTVTITALQNLGIELNAVFDFAFNNLSNPII